MSSPLIPLKWQYAAVPGGPINRTFDLTGAFAPETIDSGSLESRIASANAGAGDGDFDEEGRDDARLITLVGKIVGDCTTGDEYQDARNKWDQLGRALLRGQRGKLWRYPDRYFNCQIKSRRRESPDDGIGFIAWSAVFRAADPYLWSADYQPDIALPTADGSYALDTGCSAPCLPIISVNLTHAGTVTFTHAGQTMTLTTTTTGLFIINCELARAGGPAGDATVLVGGEWMELYPSATTLDVAYSGGAVSSATTLKFTRRWTE